MLGDGVFYELIGFRNTFQPFEALVCKGQIGTCLGIVLGFEELFVNIKGFLVVALLGELSGLGA